MTRNDFLFSDISWSAVDRNQRRKMLSEIERVDPDRLLNTSVDDMAHYYSEKFKVDVPVLDEDSIVVDESEKEIDLSRDPTRYIRDRSKPYYVTGSEIEVEISFTGSADAFNIQPNPHTHNPPKARVRGNILAFTITGVDLEATKVRGDIDRTVREIQSCLTSLRNNVEGLNSQLADAARSAIEARRNKLLANRKTVASLGFKMKERDGTPRTYVPNEIRKKISPVMPQASTAPYVPEPTLDSKDYEHILGVVEGMAKVMELSPFAFHSLGEEALRTHFLVQLNGHYQGQATGETFNFKGKTDILIRSTGRNIFIAECKFWSGSNKLSETIDQLLGYSSWRDTKTAIIVFNRNRNFSKVLEAIPNVVRSHPQYKRDLSGSTETVFRYLFANRDDRNREIYLTVMAFDVPVPEPKGEQFGADGTSDTV